MLKPTLTQIKEREAKYQDLTAKIETAERQARRLPALQLEYATLQQDLLSLEKQLPTDKDLPNIIRVITRQALQENLQFVKLAPKPSVHQTYFEIIPFDLQFSGGLHALARFLAALGQQDRIFQAQNVNLTMNSSSDPQLGTILNISLLIQTYAYTKGAADEIFFCLCLGSDFSHW